MKSVPSSVGLCRHDQPDVMRDHVAVELFLDDAYWMRVATAPPLPTARAARRHVPPRSSGSRALARCRAPEVGRSGCPQRVKADIDNSRRSGAAA